MKYTKGEWHTHEPNRDKTLLATNDKLIAVLLWGASISPEEQEANAQLISAAPLLYEACKQALRTFEARSIPPTDPRRLVLEQALAKAEGK